MPRAAKKETEVQTKRAKAQATSDVKKSTVKKSAKKVDSKTTSAKETTAKVTKTVKKSDTSVKKKVAKKSTASSAKKTTTKKSASKVTKKKLVKVPSLATKRSSSTSSKKAKEIKEVKKDFANILEYYDLPYRYNETVVKILAQTPKVLFVYWDLSDNDREKYMEKYGEYFFNDTYPVLVVHNKTLNYYQEIEINDFANSWYISISDSRSEYVVELGRRFKDYAKRNQEMPHKEDVNSFIYVAESNNLIMPNDHVLLNEVKPQVKYRNVKTGEEFYKDTHTILAHNKLVDFYELYQGIYQVEDLSDFFALDNPSSGNPTSTFK